MRLLLSQNALRLCLARIARIVPTKALPPWSCVLLETQPDALRMTAMNAAVVLRVSLNAQVLEPGRAMVSVPAFRASVEAMQDGEIGLDTQGHTVHATLGRRRVTTQGLPPDDYPAIPALGPSAMAFSVTADALAGVLKFTRHAAGDDPEKIHAYGVRLVQSEGRLTAMATDGSRAAMATIPAEGPNLDVFVIRPALREVLDWADDRVTIARDSERIELSCRNANVSWRDGTEGTPDLRPFFQREAPCWIEVPRLAMLQATDAVTSVARQDSIGSHCVELRAKSSGELSLCSHNEGTSAVDGLEGTVLSGNPGDLRLGLNGTFVMDALSASTSAVARIGLEDALSPVRIATTDLDAVIMPIRLAEESHASTSS